MQMKIVNEFELFIDIIFFIITETNNYSQEMVFTRKQICTYTLTIHITPS